MYITCAVWTVFFPFYINTTDSDRHMLLVSGAYLIIGLGKPGWLVWSEGFYCLSCSRVAQ